jgi:hypothetical protein
MPTIAEVLGGRWEPVARGEEAVPKPSVTRVVKNAVPAAKTPVRSIVVGCGELEHVIPPLLRVA